MIREINEFFKSKMQNYSCILLLMLYGDLILPYYYYQFITEVDFLSNCALKNSTKHQKHILSTVKIFTKKCRAKNDTIEKYYLQVNVRAI